MEFIEALDLGSLFGIGNLQQPWLTPLLWLVALAGSQWVLAAVALVAGAGFGFCGRWRTGLLVVLVCLATTLLCQAAQPLVGRPRPDVAWVAAGRPPGFGFPNDAATVSVATYGLILLSGLPWLKSRVWKTIVSLAVVALVLGIGFSQMYLAWGYLSDVVGGWALGLSMLLFFRWLDLNGWWNQPRDRAAFAAAEEVPRPAFNRGSESVTVKESGLRPDNPHSGASR